MSVIIYKCDTCKRELEIIPNEQGLNITTTCIITEGCKGALYKIGERATGVFGKAVDDVEGLDNFRPRVVLATFDQILADPVWKIEHNLNTDPVVHVYKNVVIEDIETQILLDLDDFVVVYVDNNNIRVEFSTATSGTVHLIARSTKPEPIASIDDNIVLEQVTANSFLIIGTLLTDDDLLVSPPIYPSKEINFISPSTGVVTSVDVPFLANKHGITLNFTNSPWNTVDTMSFGGNVYKVRSIRITDITASNDIETGSPFYFTDTDDWIILLSTAPYSQDIVDINVTEFFYPAVLSSDSTVPNSFLSDDEMVIDVIDKTQYHPEIKITTTIFD